MAAGKNNQPDRSRFLLNEQPLFILPSLACAVGVTEAIILQQLHYWLQVSNHEHDGRKWIYQKVDDWHAKLPFIRSERTIRTALERMRDMGFLLVGRYNKLKYDKTNWYSIDYQKFEEFIGKSDWQKLPVGQKKATGKIHRIDLANTAESEAARITEPIPEKREAKREAPRVQEIHAVRTDAEAFREWWGEEYKRRIGRSYYFKAGKDRGLINDLLQQFPLGEIQTRATVFLADMNPYYKKRGWEIEVFCSDINSCLPVIATVGSKPKHIIL